MVLYVPSALIARFPGRVVVIHAASAATVAAREARDILTAMSPRTAPPAMETIEQRLAGQMGPQRLGATIMGALGVIAALLTLVGVFVLVHSTIVLRRRELGLRAALGATERQIAALVLRELVAFTAAGLMSGFLLAWLGAGLIRTFLFRVAPFDIATLGTVAASLIALALAVGARPVLAAGRQDIAQILRES
jgi:putative ABC transport system permease protein